MDSSRRRTATLPGNIATHGDDERGAIVTVVIEVKGYWHKDVRTAMGGQLGDRYLREAPCHHGLYLVGWFVCPQWDPQDPRRKRVAFQTRDEARTYFDQ